jgi:hypothetical protein
MPEIVTPNISDEWLQGMKDRKVQAPYIFHAARPRGGHLSKLILHASKFQNEVLRPCSRRSRAT